jgi:TRAP transporter TAXI family solute receptor
VLDSNAGDNGWSVSAEGTKGSQENIRRIDAGELELALANSAISYFASRGVEKWGEAANIRSVMTLAPNVGLFITPSNGSVKTIADLKGRRVYLGPAGAGFDYFLRPLLAAHGVDYDEIDAVHGSQAQAVDYLSDGSADAAFLGGAVPTASITQATTSQSIRFIPYDPAAVTTLIDQFEFFRGATIPAGTYRDLDVDYPGLDVGSMHLIASGATDEEMIYQLTKTLYDHREEVVAKHPAGRAINPKNVVRDTGTAFHDGAIRFYREIGVWPTDENQD